MLRRHSPRPGRRPSTCAGRSPRCARALPTCRPGAVSRRLDAGRRDRRGGRRDLPRDRRARAGADPGSRPSQGRVRAGEGPHPLQRRLARDRRLGHRTRADLPRPRRRHPGACLGRRDPAAQPGRQPDGLGTGPARRAAHRDRRQCRRASDAAGRVDLCIVGTDRTTAGGDVATRSVLT